MADRSGVARWILDTNVLATANGHHGGVPPDCVAECAVRLQAVMENGHVVIDEGWRILRQYTENVMGPGAGFEFLQWLYQNRCNEARCTEVAITEKPDDASDFREVPGPLALRPGEHVDPSDRMFLAVAAAHPARPPIVQATDSKWIGWESALQDHAIEIEWVCRDYAEAIYARKYPRHAKGRAGGKRKAQPRRGKVRQ